MIVDHRVYASIFGVGLPAVFLICAAGLATVQNDRLQTILKRVFVADIVICLLTATCFFLDWLWS